MLGSNPLFLLLACPLFSSAYLHDQPFTKPLAHQYKGYGTYERACIQKGLLVWEQYSHEGPLDWNQPVTIIVEASSSWFSERHNFYHMSTVMLPSAAITWTFPDKVTHVVMSVKKGTWMEMTFSKFWLELIKGPFGHTKLELVNPSTISCHDNAIYIDERSYMGREIQPEIRSMLYQSCSVRPVPIMPKTALMYRRLGSGDMVNPGSAIREFLDAHAWEDEFRRRNYTVYTVSVPDDFCEQVRAWASGYEIVTSPHGAQLLVAMAAAEGTKVVEFFPDRFKSYLYCSIKYKLNLRWFNVLRVLNHIIVTEECSPEHDRSPLPGCFKGFRDGFCCRGCNWRRDRPILVGNHSELVMGFVMSPEYQEIPLNIFEDNYQVTMEAVMNVHTAARTHGRGLPNRGPSGLVGTARPEETDNGPVNDVFGLAQAIIREQSNT